MTAKPRDRDPRADDFLAAIAAGNVARILALAPTWDEGRAILDSVACEEILGTIDLPALRALVTGWHRHVPHALCIPSTAGHDVGPVFTVCRCGAETVGNAGEPPWCFAQGGAYVEGSAWRFVYTEQELARQAGEPKRHVSAPAYDTTEATAIFARARFAREPGLYREEVGRAALDLLAAVGRAAGRAGYVVRETARGTCTIARPRGGEVCLVVTEGGLVLRVAGPPMQEIADLAIAFDPVTGTFLGVDNDPIVQIPGEPWRKQPAVLVVAQRIDALLAEHEATR